MFAFCRAERSAQRFLASPSIAWLTIAALVTSLAFSGVFPTTLAMVGDRYRRHAGTVFGLVFTISGRGGMVAPPILGPLSQAYGVRAGMLVPIVGAGLVAAIAAAVRGELSRFPKVLYSIRGLEVSEIARAIGASIAV